MLEEHCEELDLTGKKDFPRIIVFPEFIASDRIEVKIKEFYRKSANTFLREEIIRQKKYDKSIKEEEQYIDQIC